MPKQKKLDIHRPGRGGDRGGHRPALYGEAMTSFKLRLPQAWIDATQAADPRGAANRIREVLEQLPEIAALKR